MITTDAIYNTLIASGSYEEGVTGTLKDGSGATVLNISNEYIKTGSLIIDNKCINNDDLEPGAVYAAELKITITGNAGLTSSQKSSLQNGSLNLTYTITDGNSSSSIPIGIYYIIEVTLKDEDVEIIAEDMMSRLSKNIPTAVREDLNFVARTPYELLDLCCQNCSTSRRPISLANDETEFDTWSNADASFLIPVTADIATYRDLVAEVAKIMGCFATIDKNTNGLILKRLNPHSNSNVWNLNEDIRYRTEKSGYICKFGKVALGNESYPDTSDEDVSGLILNMRATELTDDSELLPGIVQNLYNEMAGISYRPCKIDFMGNIALEVGDWIGVNYTEDGTTYTFRTIITHLNWILNGKELIESTGSSAATTKKVGSKGSGESRNSSSIDNLESRIETLESSGGSNKIYISELAPTTEDNAIGNEGDLWYKVKRRGHFEGVVLKCVRAGIMTHPDMSFSVGQYVRVNYGNYYNNNAPCLKYVDESWAGYKNYEYISLSASGITNARTDGRVSALWGHMIDQTGAGGSALYGMQSLRLWTCNYDEERMITSNESAVGGFGRTAVGYDVGYQGKNYWRWSTISIGGILTAVEYDSDSSDAHMVDPAAVQEVFDSFALFEIVDWGEGTNYGYDGTIIERMVLERYIKYDGVWVTADYKPGKGIIIADGEISVDTATSVDIEQTVASGTEIARINGRSIYIPNDTSNKIYTSVTAPDVALGKEGDLWVKYVVDHNDKLVNSHGDEVEVNLPRYESADDAYNYVDLTIRPQIRSMCNLATTAINAFVKAFQGKISIAAYQYNSSGGRNITASQFPQLTVDTYTINNQSFNVSDGTGSIGWSSNPAYYRYIGVSDYRYRPVTNIDDFNDNLSNDGQEIVVLYYYLYYNTSNKKIEYIYGSIRHNNISHTYWDDKLYKEISDITIDLINTAFLTVDKIYCKISDDWVGYDGDGGNVVVVNQILQSGTEIAQISVDGEVVSIYAPTPQNVSVTQTQTSGTEIGNITINNNTTTLYAPPSSKIISHTTAEWESLGVTTISENGVLYVYTDYKQDESGNNIPGFKMGDGNAYVADLPFSSAMFDAHMNNTDIHITAAEREKWNNKVSVLMNESTNNLFFITG